VNDTLEHERLVLADDDAKWLVGHVPPR
jgi:hypothetical protein